MDLTAEMRHPAGSHRQRYHIVGTNAALDARICFYPHVPRGGDGQLLLHGSHLDVHACSSQSINDDNSLHLLTTVGDWY
jgi:hypothetical protein